MPLGLWVHEIGEDKIKDQNGDINSVAAPVISGLVFRNSERTTYYFHAMDCKAMGFTNWLKAFAIVPTEVKIARPLVRS